MSLLKSISSGEILFADGGIGTMLQAAGLKPGECPELWCLTRPDDVRAIHRAYREAGSVLTKTNSFGGTRYKLAKFGLADKVYEINRAAAALAKCDNENFVLGCIGPTGEFMEPLGDETEEAMIAAFTEQAQALRDGGADAVTIETMSAIEECVAGIKAAKTIPGLVVFASFTFEKQANGEYASMMGVTPAAFAKAAIEAGADVIGANCGRGAEQMIEIVKEMVAEVSRLRNGGRNAAATIPISAMPNAGLPVLENGATVFPGTPDEFAHDILRLREAGATILGGCCGSTPRHINAAKLRVKSYEL